MSMASAAPRPAEPGARQRCRVRRDAALAGRRRALQLALAVILYAFLALLAWPGGPVEAPRASVATSGRLGRAAPRILWAVLWGSLAFFTLQPPNRSPGGLASILSGMRTGEPGWISAMDGFGAGALAHHGTGAAVILAALCGLAAVTVAAGRFTRLGVAAAAVLGLAIWLAEDFGGIFTGQGTDPNSGLLLIVVAAAFWPLPTRMSAGLRRAEHPGLARRGRGDLAVRPAWAVERRPTPV